MLTKGFRRSLSTLERIGLAPWFFPLRPWRIESSRSALVERRFLSDPRSISGASRPRSPSGDASSAPDSLESADPTLEPSGDDGTEDACPSLCSTSPPPSQLLPSSFVGMSGILAKRRSGMGGLPEVFPCPPSSRVSTAWLSSKGLSKIPRNGLGGRGTTTGDSSGADWFC